jgi:flagellar protein FlgJ
MSTTPVGSEYYADFGRLEALKKTARQDQPAAVREAARQFESLFTNMLLKSMREASMGESLGDSEQTQFYQGMFDQQLALQMSRGKGLGLAEHLVQQLQRTGVAPAAPGAARATGSDPQPTLKPLTREQFINRVQPYAEQAAQRLGVAPETIIAHAALETGWGQHLPATAAGSSNNLFGIKAGGAWRGAAAEAITTEYTRGATAVLRAPFRAYDTVAASMRDYANLIAGNPRYAGALNQGADAAAYAAGLQRGGYASDPAYVQKLVATAAAVRDLNQRGALKIANAAPITSGGETA